MKTDIVSGIFLLGLSIATLLGIRQLPVGTMTSPQAGFFPLLLGIILAALSLVLITQATRDKQAKKKKENWESSGGLKRICLTLAVLFGVGFFFESLGYLISAFFLIAFLLICVGNQKWWLAITAGLLSAMFSYLIFGMLLKGSLPAGFLA